MYVNRVNILEYASQPTSSELPSRSFGPGGTPGSTSVTYMLRVVACMKCQRRCQCCQQRRGGTGRESGSAEYVSSVTILIAFAIKVDGLGSANGVSMLRCNEYWRHHCWVRRRSRNVQHKSMEHVFRNPVVYIAQHELLTIRTFVVFESACACCRDAAV